MFGGILDGKDVVWVAQDYPNLTTVMWREEFKPRFEHLSWCKVKGHPDYTIEVKGKGTLFLRSAEAIHGLRGFGKNLGGLVIDEAAWLDLEESMLDVILPALMDNEAWLILMSTTNAGPDGNQAKRVPSYFNVICEEIRAGKRSDDWVEFTGTAFDNPHLSRKAIDELIAEYPANSPKLKQEVFAELLVGGVGVALPELDKVKHFTEVFVVPSHWTHFGAFDWGYNHPWCFGWFVADEAGNVYLRDTIWGVKQQPKVIAATITATVPVKRLRTIHAGHDILAQVKARGEDVPTLQQQFRKLGIPMVAANISRVAGLTNFNLYLEWQACDVLDENGTVVSTIPEREPRLQLFNTPGNVRLFEQLARMQIDPKNIEDALKVDAVSGAGGDDGYDMCRYGLASRPLKAGEAPKPKVVSVTSDVVLEQEAEKFRRVDQGLKGPKSVDPRKRGTFPGAF